MKVVDAVWEKRNLGVNTQEITILASDSIEEVEKTLKTLSAEYQVVKIPTGNTKVMWKLEDMGFRYIETIVHVENSLKNLELKGIPKRINDELTYELMNQKDRNQMFEEIRKGMFKTDRVALDSNFSLQQANNRYIGWISDEIEKGTEVFKYIYHNQTIGFFTFKEIARGVYYPFLAGIYKQYQNFQDQYCLINHYSYVSSKLFILKNFIISEFPKVFPDLHLNKILSLSFRLRFPLP